MDELKTRVEKLLRRMTVEEKVAQMVQVPYAMVSREEAIRWAKLGAGSFLHVLGDDAREIQQVALNTRLGIPVLFGIDAIHGHGLNDHATIFPSQLAAACSWDAAEVERMGRVTAREVATDGLHWTFSPVLCLGRDTRWGRIDETFGEDSYLSGEMGAAIIRGYQGSSLSDQDSILACAKHYIGYGEAVGARDACDTEMTFRKLREVFLPPFKRAVEAGCATFMTAYGAIDGTPFTVSRKTLHDILRDELGFDGFVVTDWDNTESLVSLQHVCKDIGEASRKAAEAGNDMIMTTTAFFEAALKEINEGRLSEDVIDEAVRHILTIKFRMGLFETPEKKGIPGCIGCKAHQEQALALARKSVVLLRNRGMLPLNTAKMRRVAVIGPNADDIRAQYGDWTYFTHPMPDPSRQPVRPYVTLLEGMRAEAEKRGVEIVYANGCGVFAQADDDLQTAVNVASDCDAIILALGDRVEQTGEGKDRADLALSGQQDALFKVLKQTGKPIVTVLISSKPLCAVEEEGGSDAFICAFNGGMFGGQAVAEVIFGATEPVGRLPISFPTHSGQVPAYYNQLPGWHGGRYMDQPETPLFAFGEGLSYTNFRYSDLKMDADTLTARVTVTNTGDSVGNETVQFYIHDVVSSVMTPVKKLVAFKQICLQPGESQTVCATFTREDVSVILPDETAVIEPGEFEVLAGHSSKAEDLLTCAFSLS